MNIYMEQLLKGDISGPSRSPVLDAFRWNGHLIVMGRLVRLRRENRVDLDRADSRFGNIYLNLQGSWVNATSVRVSIGADWLYGGGALFSVEELASEEFQRHANDASEDSNTAAVICNYLAIMYNISSDKSLKIVLGEQLRANGFFVTIETYLLSRSLFLYFCEFSKSPISIFEFLKYKNK